MNQKDRDRMARLYTALNDIPMPNTGSGGPSASIKGISTYASDMHTARPMLLSSITAISRSDSEWEDPDGELDDLEEWVATRKEQGWD